MVTISLDQITRNVLLRKGYSLHWYMQAILFAKDCLRQLVEDDLQVTNSKIIPVDQTTNCAVIPSDFLDYIVVGYRNGQAIVPLVESNSLDDIDNYDSDWNSVRIGSENAAASNSNSNLYGYYGFGSWFVNHYNNWGENVGRFYGGVAYYDTFKIIKKRNVIKINNALSLCNIALVYISNGMDSSTATQITPYAQETIESYIYYQFKLNNRTSSLGEIKMAEDDYIKNRIILRARMSDLDVPRLKRIVHRNSYSSPKS